jgi:hypothetical protein
MHKGKAIPVRFPVKSAEELALSLGMSKKRFRRIVEIVEKVSGKPFSATAHRNGRSGRSVAVNSRNSRTGQRSHATTRKTAKARH